MPPTSNEEKTYDIGTNAEKLGILYLIFKYVLPIVAWIVVIVLMFLFVTWFIPFIVSHPANYQSPALPQATQIQQ